MIYRFHIWFTASFLRLNIGWTNARIRWSYHRLKLQDRFQKERMWITPLAKYASQNAPEENALDFLKSQLLRTVYDSHSSKSCSGHQTRTKRLSCQEAEADNEMYIQTARMFHVCLLYLYVLSIYTYTFKLNHLINTFIIYQNFIISRSSVHIRSCKIKLLVSLLFYFTRI